jgi:hypothetical protein
MVLDMSINPGNSRGPVCDGEGVAGVVWARHTDPSLVDSGNLSPEAVRTLDSLPESARTPYREYRFDRGPVSAASDVADRHVLVHRGWAVLPRLDV